MRVVSSEDVWEGRIGTCLCICMLDCDMGFVCWITKWIRRCLL